MRWLISVRSRSRQDVILWKRRVEERKRSKLGDSRRKNDRFEEVGEQELHLKFLSC